ncbi:methionyl aminopeptidase [Actinopolyspora mzabensis]|uniref:Methionine aminopeptidase n=1 Tax=Actinopolyspora mzabensis TaxID=995066 RepID=A0A1G9CPC0_ACTMZ|nr:type I methionyl aminopeptidase [Actinopolyspora mzabensis]SDK53304.1 methionyl aminopeptidase [Actinopolyspora mzabensis]
MIELKTPGQIASMRAAGRVVGQALREVRRNARVGTTPLELDRTAEAVIDEAGAVPAFRGYQPSGAPTPFPGVICASVNDAVVHGIPDDTELADGDLVSIDCGAFVDGWCGDAAISFTVGSASPADQRLIDSTEAALRRGIEAAVADAKLGDVAHAIGAPAREEGYGLLADHGGHGIGRAMHEAPHVPNEGRPGRGFRLRAGLVLAIEPMLLPSGRDHYRTDPDGWTLRTADGGRAAHCEHTVAVTEDGPVVLTEP